MFCIAILKELAFIVLTGKIKINLFCYFRQDLPVPLKKIKIKKNKKKIASFAKQLLIIMS